MRRIFAPVKSAGEVILEIAVNRCHDQPTNWRAGSLRVSFKMSPLVARLSIFGSSAEKKISAGAPSVICRASKPRSSEIKRDLVPILFFVDGANFF